MNTLVFFAVLGACAAFPQGGLFISDTPEVIAEKNRFFSLFNQMAAAAAAAPDPIPSGRQQAKTAFTFPTVARSQPQPAPWRGPVAATIPASLPGSTPNVLPTADVQNAIAEFARAYQSALKATSPKTAIRGQARTSFAIPAGLNIAPIAQEPQPWTGPLAASIPAGLPGATDVFDTPEVEAAKAAFARAFVSQLHAVQPVV